MWLLEIDVTLLQYALTSGLDSKATGHTKLLIESEPWARHALVVSGHCLAVRLQGRSTTA